MRIAVATDQISRDVDTACEQITSWGCRDVELRLIGGGPIGSNLASEFLDDLCTTLWRWDVRVSAIAPQVLKVEVDDPAMRYHRSILLPISLHLAVLLKAPLVQIGAPRRPRGGTHGPCPDNVLEVLAEAAELAGNLGLKLGLENEQGSWVTSGAEAAAVVETVGHHALGVTWDPAVSLMNGEAPFPTAFHAVLPHLVSIRVRDIGQVGPRFEGVLPGDGLCMIGEIMAELIACGFDGTAVLDPRLSPRLEGARATYETVERIRQAVTHATQD